MRDVMPMFNPDKFWSRREFLKVVGQAGLLSAVPTLTRAAAALDSETVPSRSCIRRTSMAIFCRLPITTEILIAVEWRVASRKSGVGNSKILIRS